ncbi:MAG: hypothetical protein NTV34_08600 [Proteobacteria bacterium]|nr:hypothetical protein [Pseudomonadota bacterium]
MNFLWMIPVVLSAFANKAGAAEADSTFKIRSHACSDLGKVRTGSAVLVNTLTGDPQFVTSSHVIFHGGIDLGICHEFLHGNTWKSLEFIEANSGLGVATLKAKSVEGLVASLLNREAPLVHDTVTLEGFPLLSATSVRGQGQILAMASQRIQLPLVSGAIEVSGAHNEYGMSGGGAFVSEMYLGMISHQYVAINSGHEGETIVVGPNSAADKLVSLVIPSQAILDWLNLVKSERGAMRENVNDQLRGRLSLTFGHLKFSQMDCGPGSGGIGGEGAGVGGEGAGVGGEGESVPQTAQPTDACHIIVEKLADDESFPQSWPFQQSEDWFNRTAQRMVVGQPSSFYEIFSSERSIKVRGLYHVLTRMRDGFIPLLHLSSGGHLPRGLAERILPIRALLQQLKSTSSLPNAPFESGVVLSYIERSLEFIEQEEIYRVDVSALRKALRVGRGEPHNAGWIFLYNQDLDNTIEFVKQITVLCDLIERL